MESCIACSMPLSNSSDVGARVDEGAVCIHCATADGKMKSCEEIFEGGVQFFMGAVPGTERALAERLTRKNMNMLAYWQKNKGACLNGEEASEQEFEDAMSKL